MAKQDKRNLIIIVLLVIGIVLLTFALGDFMPTVGDKDASANNYLSTYYIEHSIPDTETPNIVAAILADYRGFDTLFETCVMFLSGVTALMVLFTKKKDTRSVIEKKNEKMKNVLFGGTVLQTSFRLVVPIIMIYAFYVLAFGEVSLGGGFQAGALLAAVYLTDRLIPSFHTPITHFSGETAAATAGVGVFIYAFTGILPMFNGGKLFEYEKLPFGFLVDDVVKLHSVGIFMIEVGVTIAVMATIIAILEAVLERTDFNE